MNNGKEKKKKKINDKNDNSSLEVEARFSSTSNCQLPKSTPEIKLLVL